MGDEVADADNTPSDTAPLAHYLSQVWVQLYPECCSSHFSVNHYNNSNKARHEDGRDEEEEEEEEEDKEANGKQQEQSKR
ncbi:hypothetical protein ACLKA6_007004 [Drosophila palustris]